LDWQDRAVSTANAALSVDRRAVIVLAVRRTCIEQHERLRRAVRREADEQVRERQADDLIRAAAGQREGATIDRDDQPRSSMISSPSSLSSKRA
jgi:hypothetical protein